MRDWTGAEPRIVSLEPNALADVWTDIQNVAEALGAPDRGERLGAELQAWLCAIEAQTEQSAHRPSVACIEWIDPLMAGGNWVPELVGMAGGVNIYGEAARHSPTMTWDALCQSQSRRYSDLALRI